MKTLAEKGKQSGLYYDLRVRARHVASGALDQKSVDQHLAELPDMEENAETITNIEQPALRRSGDGHGDGDA